MKVDFYRHHIDDAEVSSVLETLKSSFLTAGPKTSEFEKKFADYIGAKYAVGLTSCTAGLFLALKALNIQAGDEVIVPAMTFMATGNVVMHCGARPVLVDVEADTGLIDVHAVESAITSKTKAVIPVHLYGHLADMKGLRNLADTYGFALIEDAAHAVESEREGYRTGTLGDVAAFSFYATKNIASGEGGAITTGRQDLHDKIRLLRQHGMSKSASERYHGAFQHYDMLALGYKYNMFDIQAALLIPQLRTLESYWLRREQICKRYETAFSEVGIEFPIVRSGCKSARHLFTIWSPRGRRDKVLGALQERQIGVAVNYRAMHVLGYYRDTFGFKPADFPVAEDIGERTITLPLYPRLKDEEVDYVIQNVIELLGET